MRGYDNEHENSSTSVWENSKGLTEIGNYDKAGECEAILSIPHIHSLSSRMGDELDGILKFL